MNKKERYIQLLAESIVLEIKVKAYAAELVDVIDELEDLRKEIQKDEN